MSDFGIYMRLWTLTLELMLERIQTLEAAGMACMYFVYENGINVVQPRSEMVQTELCPSRIPMLKP